ncbi:hypothetical protein AAE478_007373 [Parahypoxylon ruwenzoriense]
MGQTFQLVAPRDRLFLPYWGKLGEILFDGSAADLVRLLAVPIRRQAHTSYPLCRKLAEMRQGNSDDKVYHHSRRATISHLPLEGLCLIFSYLEDPQDIIHLGLAGPRFWAVALDYMDAYYSSLLGRWAGKNIVCVGGDVEPGDFPPGLFSEEETELHPREVETLIYDDYPEYGSDVRPFTLYHFTYPSISEIERETSVQHVSTGFYVDYLERKEFNTISMQSASSSDLCVEESDYLPTNQPWILRNLTTKEFVRAESIALEPEDISGPNITYLGFGEVVMSRICWSTSPSVSMQDDTNISRGVWAGHKFDITTVARHEAETKNEVWRDVGDEIAREIATIWEGDYGPDWRKVIRERRGLYSYQ